MTNQEAEHFAKTYIKVIKSTHQEFNEAVFMRTYMGPEAEAQLIWSYVYLHK